MGIVILLAGVTHVIAKQVADVDSVIPVRIVVTLLLGIGVLIGVVVWYDSTDDPLGITRETVNDLLVIFIVMPLIFFIIWHEILEPIGSSLWRWLRGEDTDHLSH